MLKVPLNSINHYYLRWLDQNSWKDNLCSRGLPEGTSNLLLEAERREYFDGQLGSGTNYSEAVLLPFQLLGLIFTGYVCFCLWCGCTIASGMTPSVVDMLGQCTLCFVLLLFLPSNFLHLAAEPFWLWLTSGLPDSIVSASPWRHFSFIHSFIYSFICSLRTSSYTFWCAAHWWYLRVVSQ